MRPIGLALWTSLVAACATSTPQPAPPRAAARVIIIILDGLRPDSISRAETPNLYELRESGTDFTDNHATYPTFTMMNAASFATGGFPGTTGYYGNVLWQPDAKGKDFANKPVDFRQPVFSEDYAILDAIDRCLDGKLFLVDGLFDAAHRAGMTTATIGKNGASYVLDYKRHGLMLDEKTALPLSFAKELQDAGIPLPTTTGNAYLPGELVLKPSNGNPIESKPVKRLKDGVTADPTDTSGSPYKTQLQYLVNTYLDFILSQKEPRLTALWLRDPDTTQHNYGVGSANYRDALSSTDRLLGQVRSKLRELGQDATTDIIVVSDHGHNNVAGSSALFPLRAIKDGEVGKIDPNGYSVSGLVRLADLFRRAGFVAFDGLGCSYLPVASGIKADGSPVYKTLIDADGSICGTKGQKYLSPSLKVPGTLPPKALVIAVSGGSDYIYVPDRDRETVRKAVELLQSRSEVGAIFVDARYQDIPGTLPLQMIRAQNTADRNPDIIVSYEYDENDVVNGVKGTEYSGILLNSSYRGMHGGFGPLDVHNTLIAYGPDFREHFKDTLPTGNVDIAPTVARILQLPLPPADGRLLLEALKGGPSESRYSVSRQVIQPKRAATGLRIRLPTDPDGKDIDAGKSTYTFELQTKFLTYEGKTYRYFDLAKAVRR